MLEKNKYLEKTQGQQHLISIENRLLEQSGEEWQNDAPSFSDMKYTLSVMIPLILRIVLYSAGPDIRCAKLSLENKNTVKYILIYFLKTHPKKA